MGYLFGNALGIIGVFASATLFQACAGNFFAAGVTALVGITWYKVAMS